MKRERILWDGRVSGKGKARGQRIIVERRYWGIGPFQWFQSFQQFQWFDLLAMTGIESIRGALY